MKELLEDMVRSITASIKRGEFTVDYRNKAFVRIHMADGLQVDLHKFGDVCLTYRGTDTQEAYLLAKKKAIAEEIAKNESARQSLECELREVEAELGNV